MLVTMFDNIFISFTTMPQAGVYVLIFLISVIHVQSQQAGPVNLLLKLVSRNSQKPMVVYMDAAKKRHNTLDLLIDDGKPDGENKLYDDLLLNDGLDDDTQTLQESAKDQAKILLYRFLRTTPDANPELEETKQILRDALRSRCAKVDTCVNKCKVIKPSCPKKCKDKFDELDLCEPPKPKKKKCGKTMPPSWRF